MTYSVLLSSKEDIVDNAGVDRLGMIQEGIALLLNQKGTREISAEKLQAGQKQGFNWNLDDVHKAQVASTALAIAILLYSRNGAVDPETIMGWAARQIDALSSYSVTTIIEKHDAQLLSIVN